MQGFLMPNKTCQIEWCETPAAFDYDFCLLHMAPATLMDRALSPATLADYLGTELTDWQRKFLDDIFDPSHKDEHLEWRFIGRKIGHGWVWVPNA